MKVRVETRSGRELIKGGLELSDDATVADLQAALHAKLKKFYPSRQRLTLPLAPDQKKPTVLERGKKLSDYFSNSSKPVVVFKDLGPQITWTTLFVMEYLGPLLLYPLFYLFPDVLYPWAVSARVPTNLHHPYQLYALLAWEFHYAKRILETLFVHRYSHDTVGYYFLLKNCTYYWGFALVTSYFLNHPLYTPVGETQMLVGFAIFAVAQLSNFYTHVILRNIRPPGSKGYFIPKGFLFNYVTCANYTTEIWAWIGFNIATQSLFGWVFLACGASQMIIWAIGKHKRLRRIFDGKDGTVKYPRRWVIFPPFF